MWDFFFKHFIVGEFFTEFLNELKISEESLKKHWLEIKFKAHAANHRIKALENQISIVHTERLQKELLLLRFQK